MADRLPAPTVELGSAANYGSEQGFPFDLSEDSPELQWPLNIIVFDRMRRQDGQIIGTLNALTLPLRQGQWFLDPQEAKPEVVTRIAENLAVPILGQDPQARKRRRDRFSWSRHLPMACLMLAYGHMPFEKVCTIGDDGLATLARVNPRMPRTLQKLKTDKTGELEKITQYGTGVIGTPPMVDIERNRLAYYSNQREGANWQGQSVLRASYKNWMLKDRLMRVDAMTIERNGMGVPWVEAAQGSTKTQIDDLATMAKSYRAGEKSGMALPNGSRFHLAGVEGQTPSAIPSIRYHDEQITRPMLEMFMQLGSTHSGSRALGSSFIDFFGMALNALAEELATTATEDIVEWLVDVNYGIDEPAPSLTYQVIDSDHDIPPESLTKLIQIGAIEMDDDLEYFLRTKYVLPARNSEQTARAVLPLTTEVPGSVAPSPVAASDPGSRGFAGRPFRPSRPKRRAGQEVL